MKGTVSSREPMIIVIGIAVATVIFSFKCLPASNE